MAATVAVVHNIGGVGISRTQKIITVTMDSSYATGGEAITANACGLSRIDYVNFHGPNIGFTPEWDQTNLKVKALERYSFGWSNPRISFGSQGLT